MRRPHFVHFTSIESDESIHVRASLSISSQAQFHLLEELQSNLRDIVPTTPIQSVGLMRSDEFRLKVIGLNNNGDEVLVRSFDSDSFGSFNFKIPQYQDQEQLIKKLKIFETKFYNGLELLMGHFIPTQIHQPKKIIITDFDKTLCDTRYHTAKELYLSLKNPLNFFPEVVPSTDIFRKYITDGFQPFVVSASPHFYENALRDWLYQHQIFTAHIFLKDYRNIFSFFEGELTTKDLKTQGFYKLNHIVNILIMTGIPDELVLMGDGFESDTLIYLTLAALLNHYDDPWAIWNQVKKEESFKLTNKQHFRFLSKIYQLRNMSLGTHHGIVKIYIRCKPDMIERLQNRTFPLHFAEQLKHLVHYYVG